MTSVQIVHLRDYVDGDTFLKDFFKKYRVHLEAKLVLNTAKILSLNVVVLDDKLLIPLKQKSQLMEKLWKNTQVYKKGLKK